MHVYQLIDAALIRAAVLPVARPVPPWPDLAGTTDADAQRWRTWIREAWADDAVVEAIEVASPGLARRVDAVCAGTVDKPRQILRAALSLMRYLLRMQHRATPFGLFAGIAPLRFGPASRVHWHENHRTVVRADAVWLTDVITNLEACPELLRRLPVSVDATAFVRGDRLVVPFQQPPHHTEGSPSEVNLRHTGAIRTLLAAAAQPVMVDELAAKLSADYPDTPAQTIAGLLSELISRRVLLTSLHPPMTATDALGHLVGQLKVAEAATIDALASTVHTLDEIHQDLTRLGHAPLTHQRKLRTAATTRMKSLANSVEQPLAVDLHLGCEVDVPHQVAREAEKAARLLIRLSPYPSGSPSWQDFHSRFLERYGTGALVPVRDLVDLDTGLGYPAGYRSSPATQTPPPRTRRDEKLLALLQQAALEGAEEVALDEKTLAALTVKEATQVPAHLELCFRLDATTRAALDSGDFQLVVTGLATSAGTTTGRFLYLLGEEDRDRVITAYSGLPTTQADALRAQISSPPLLTRTENVARAPQVWPHVISLAEHALPHQRLNVEDLAVGADPQRLHLISLSTRQPVEPSVFNAVQLTNFTHPLARFLCELPRARAAVLAPFSWGAAHNLPYLPRVRHGRTVLAPARWKLHAGDFPGPDAEDAEWSRALAAWQRRYHLSSTVFLGDDDRRIGLNLDETAHRQLLRSHLNRTGHATLHEAPDTGAYGWLDGHAQEIVIPLAATEPPPPRRSRPTTWHTLGRDHGHLPGASPWLYATLYSPADRHLELLTRHLPALLTTWSSTPEWWFVRYRDPADHLRLRFRLPDADAYGPATQHIGTWAADLRQRGLISSLQLDTYYPEMGRYGTGEAMAAAETVFAADSAAVLAQMAQTALHGGVHPQALTAASLVDIAAGILGSTRAGMRWLIDHVPKQLAETSLTRHIHDEAIRLTCPDGGSSLLTVPGGHEIAAVWSQRRSALTAYRTRLIDSGGPAPETVLPSLLHMHHIRMHGIDEECERACHRLARAAALSWASRSGGIRP